jgi:hypothetical protein
MRLHRYWIWANYAKRTFEEALSSEGWDDYEDLTARTPWAMYLWYSTLHTVVAGFTSRSIRLAGQLRADLKQLREPLRDARNAVLHAEEDSDCFDTRLVTIVRQDATRITRVHMALGQLLLDELRRRRGT